MNRTARVATVAALAVLPALFTATPASAYCTLSPVPGPAEVYYCNDPFLVCGGVDTKPAYAAACYGAGVFDWACSVDVPHEGFVACA